ncbi:MAG: DJ-1/PfpI family protein [Actinomycetia bacterium]|nr:DJ-1/PfpI family protein [Actinomycetes bacterium]
MQIAIALYPELTALDAMGPYAVLSQLPGAEVVLCAPERGRVSDDNGLLHLEVDHALADVPEPDVLLVPGGFVTRSMAREGNPVVEWVRAAHPGTTFTTSVCTGSLVLGAAGVLDGLDATTHWSAYDALASFGAKPTGTRVVRQGKVITAAGVSAGIDMALTLAAAIAGDEVAQAIQLGIEYDPQPPFDSGSPDKSSPDVRDLVAAVMAD